MAINALTGLANYIKALGQAYVYIGATTPAGSLVSLGATEGEIQVEETFQYNDLKAPEWTGDAVHARKLDGQHIKVTVPIIMGDSALYTKIHPLGVKGGGRSKPTAVVPTTLLLAPFSEVDPSLAYNGTVWTPAAPVHAVWIWKAIPTPGRYGFKHGDGGKVIREITFEAMFDDTKPEGQKLYSIGDPAAQGVTGLLI